MGGRNGHDKLALYIGGIKESGHGREGGIEGLEPYTYVKFISQAEPG